MDSTRHNCVVCKSHKHPLYGCVQFKSLPHDEMVSMLKSHHICMNYIRPGHFVKECTSQHQCRICQKPYHTLLHLEHKDNASTSIGTTSISQPVVSNTATRLSSKSLLMMCCVLVDAPDGSSMEARAILDSASSASFVSEHSSEGLHLPRSRPSAGISHNPPLQAVTSLSIYLPFGLL